MNNQTPFAGATQYQQCVRCVMDTTAKDITFDASGACNYCSAFIKLLATTVNEQGPAQELRLKSLVTHIKKTGKRKRYDCIIGLSGGVDSAWVLTQAVHYGLRPLAVHMDNGWNSELSQNNIEQLIQSLNIDLVTYVVEWDEYRRLMQAFFDADVIDIELLYDNAMLAVNYRTAAKHNVNFILAGTNQATEGMRIPSGWNWFKLDRRNIKSIARASGIKTLKSFPAIGTAEYLWRRYANHARWLSFLDYLPYDKFEALDELERRFAYKRYPYKHYESVFTRFYQGYILPRKFGVDKRRLHLATLVISGQMNRDDALDALEGSPYPTEAEMEADVDYFLKKMRWSPRELTDYISRPERSHTCYATERPIWNFLSRIRSYYKLSG